MDLGIIFDVSLLSKKGNLCNTHFTVQTLYVTICQNLIYLIFFSPVLFVVKVSDQNYTNQLKQL